jgi:hypothetical protein
MTSNSRRSCWTTQRPSDRAPHFTLHPQVEGALRSSSCLHAHHSRNNCVLRWPSPSCPNPNNSGKGKDKGKGKGKAKNNDSGSNNGDNGRGAPAWPSFYNPWIDTISMCLGMRPPQQLSVHPSQHALLIAPAYYGASGGPSFAPLPAPLPHQ